MSVVKLTTPGVYVQEISALPPSVAEVETAIPAFVGYTAKAERYAPDDLKLVPTKINSISEYERLFGRSAVEKDDAMNNSITINVQEPTATVPNYLVSVSVDRTKVSKYNMYYALRHFFDNGGGTCYIVSVDKYAGDGSIQVGDDKSGLLGGLKVVADVDEVTLLVVPEASHTGSAGYKSVVQAMISQAASLKDRFALIDPYQVTPKDKDNPSGQIDTDVAIIRGAGMGVDENRYAAAYYPNLQTTYNYNYGYDEPTGKYNINGIGIENYLDKDGNAVSGVKMNDSKVPYGSALYSLIVTEFQKQFVVLPPSPAMAGIYARVDANKGVWKAPANEAVAAVVGPTIPMSDRDQSSLNIDVNSGRSINVIRTFPGYGSIVWGARTMNGNDNEWKYISVRRFFNMVEESVKKSSQWAVFEPNTAGTWVKIQAMIENYLFLKWRDGALAGAKPEQAYYVRVGLGTTMNSVDVLEGRLNVEIGMAVARPAEFIVLKFTQLMQQS